MLGWILFSSLSSFIFGFICGGVIVMDNYKKANNG